MLLCYTKTSVRFPTVVVILPTKPGHYQHPRQHGCVCLACYEPRWIPLHMDKSTNTQISSFLLTECNGNYCSWSRALYLQDRLWRKNRSISKTSPCIGVDLNRNFDANWCSKSFSYLHIKTKGSTGSSKIKLSFAAQGASPEPCTEIYCGAFPESEPESQAVADFLRGHKDSIQLYFSIHSYSQMLLFPYSCYLTEVENHRELVTHQ